MKKYRNFKIRKFENLGLGVLIFGIYFSGCATNPNFTTAKLTRKNDVEIIPYVSKNFQTPGPYESFDYDPIDENLVFGVVTSFGLNDKTNLIFGYGIRNESIYDMQKFRFEIKRSILQENQAVAIGYRYLQFENISELYISTYSNIKLTDKTYLCVSPNITSIFLNSEKIDLNGSINSSLTHEFGNKYYLRPEIGFGVFTIFSDLLFNIGISGGIYL